MSAAETVPLFGGKPRPDLTPRPNEPGVFTDKFGNVFLSDDVEEQGVVVVPPPRATTTTTSRYDGRHVDLGPLLAAPPKPISWRVRDVVADGTLTIITGESGSGKSWLAQALCTGVARGLPVLGLPCVRGRSLYVDAEMGPEMFVDQRLRPCGIRAPEFDYIDAMGLDVSLEHDRGWLRSKIEELAAKLVVIDSLRRLTPSKAENDSDDMAPAVGSIAKLARDTGAAIILIHHKGDGEKFFRGSTAIKDQTDALFGLLREEQPDDDRGEDTGIRRLRCQGGKGKMRYAPEPPDVWLRISLEDGGVASVNPPAAPATPSRGSVREAVKDAILAALPAKSKTEVSAVVQRPLNDRTFREAWVELERSGAIAEDRGRWVVVVARPLRATTTTTSPQGSLIGDAGVCERCGSALATTPEGAVCFGCPLDPEGEGALSSTGAQAAPGRTVA